MTVLTGSRYQAELLALHRGQGLELLWRDSLQCPTEEEYVNMVNQSEWLSAHGGLTWFMFVYRDWRAVSRCCEAHDGMFHEKHRCVGVTHLYA